ncbi:g3030 [Coccomyxa viridis]|uniref:G3030 protein n=1 Tax=Coccomyxa viridis TaxID=1274662 RepID=A0ABP1FTW3_9CHLO
MWAPANLPALHQGTQPVALPCQQRHRQHTTVVPNVHQQPRLTKAVLDQHEKAALTSLLLMQQQSSPMKAPGGSHTPTPGLERMETEQLETSQPSCETSDTCSETGSSSHPPPRKAARRCLISLAGTTTPRPQRLEEPRKLAPVYIPVTRQQDFPMSRQTACAMVQNLLQHPNASTPFPAHLAASGHKRELPEPDQARSGRFFMPFAGAPRPVLPSAAPNGQGAALPDEEAPGDAGTP